MEQLRAEDPDTIGKYRVHARLGAGGMGRVYLGFSPAGRAVALKVIRSELARDLAFQERFWREVAAARQVGGAYTAAVVDAGTDRGRPWLATSFVPGPSLYGTIDAHGPLSAAASWRLAGGLAEALAAIHGCGIIHRDLTPANVLLAADGPRVIDFGLSRGLDGKNVTGGGLVLGTPGYMSPEQARGAPASPASDVFSLGCVLAFAATGIEPFGRGDPSTMIYRVVHDSPDLAGMPDPLRNLVLCCLAKNPADRPAVSQLAEVTSARIIPDPGASPASFWPDTLDKLIGSYRARLDTPALSATPGAAQTAQKESARTGQSPTQRHARHRVPGITRRRLVAGFVGVTGAGVASVWTLDRPAHRAYASSSPSRHPGPGSKIWSFATAGGVGSPAVSGGRVFAASASDAIYSLRASDGRIIWKYQTGGPDTAGAVVSGGVVYAACYDGRLYALSATSGTEQWSYAAGAPLYGTPTVSGGFVYIGREGTMASLAQLAGVEVWTRPIIGNVYYPPAVTSELVYIGTSEGRVYALRASDGAVVWERPVTGPLLGPDEAGNVVYTGSYDGHVYALRAADGALVWKYPAGGHITGAVVTGGVVYANSVNGKIYALRASDGAEIWQQPTGAPVPFSTAVVGGKVYGGNHAGEVFALSATDGSPIWSYRTDGPIQSTPAVAAGVVYVGSGDGRVYALRALRATRVSAKWNKSGQPSLSDRDRR